MELEIFPEPDPSFHQNAFIKRIDQLRIFRREEVEELTNLLSVGFTSQNDQSNARSLATRIGIYTRDIETWINGYVRQQRALMASKKLCPCLVPASTIDTNPIPIDISAATKAGIFYRILKGSSTDLISAISARFPLSYGQIRLFDYTEASRFFMESLWSFLFTRLSATVDKPPGRPNLLSFEVDTREHGLRVNYASPVWLQYVACLLYTSSE